MPTLNDRESNSSLDKLSIKEKNLQIDGLAGSKGSIYTTGKSKLKVGSVRVKYIPLKDGDSTSSIRNINVSDIKKDYDAEVKDIVTFLTKNIHLLEKEIEQKTKSIPEEESEVLYDIFNIIIFI